MQGLLFLPARNMNYQKLSRNSSLRMRRKKLNRGGDGDAHHRSTSDGGRHNKRFDLWSSSVTTRHSTSNLSSSNSVATRHSSNKFDSALAASSLGFALAAPSFINADADDKGWSHRRLPGSAVSEGRWHRGGVTNMGIERSESVGRKGEERCLRCVLFSVLW